MSHKHDQVPDCKFTTFEFIALQTIAAIKQVDVSLERPHTLPNSLHQFFFLCTSKMTQLHTDSTQYNILSTSKSK